MPLIGLEKIEWEKLTHAYGSATNVPELLRAVDIAETQDQFETATGELWNNINHQGSIYKATSVTLPFVMQIIKTSPNTYWKMRLLMCVRETLRSENLTTIQDSRHNLAIYDTMALELDYCLKLLEEVELELRVASLSILYYLIEQHERILPAILDCIEKAEDAQLKASAVWVYSRMVKFGFFDNNEAHLNQLSTWFESEIESLLVRYAAAFGYGYLKSYKLPPLVIKLIAQAFTTFDWDLKRSSNRDLDNLYKELMPFPNVALLEWMGSEFWIDILRAANPSPIQAHELVREILNAAFFRLQTANWYNNVDWTNHKFLKTDSLGSGLIYTARTDNRQRYVVGGRLGENQRFALRTIVDCEPFWEIPTNLFSFFYGLPDDRDELRKLAQGE
jgi:hypothetical protein